MPTIRFDVLCPPPAAVDIGAAFQRALDILVKHGRLASGSARSEGIALVDAPVAAQLASTYEQDRVSDPAEDGAEVHRFAIQAEGASSYNALAMGLSRVLTPKADLPRDPVLLQQQDRFEEAAIYPWTVEVLR